MLPSAQTRGRTARSLARLGFLALTAIGLQGGLGMVAFAGEPQRAERDRPVPVIEVIGRSENAVSRQTGAVVIVDQAAIDRIAPTSTEDILRRVPGINVKTEEESAIVANFGIRGLSASESKSLMLEDGVPVAPGLFIGNERYFNPRVQRIERVEILKGAAALRYGPATIGGVVNYQTRIPDRGVILSGRLGSFNTREATLEAGGRTPSGEAYGGVVVTRARSDGFLDKDFDMTDVMVKAGVELGSNQLLGVKFSFYENDANISYRGLLLDEFREGSTRNPAPDDYFLTDRRAFDVNHEFDITDSAKVKTLLYWSEVSRDYWRFNVDTAASNLAGRWIYQDTLTGNNRSFERYGFDSRLLFDHRLFGVASEAEIGVRGLKEKSDDRRIRATREQPRTGLNDRHLADSAESVSLHAQNRFALGERFAVTPGLRIEHYEQKRRVLTDNDATASTTNTEYLPGIGATFQVTDVLQLYAGAYRAFAPATNGVALDNLTDQNLDAERSDNYEIGVRGQWNRLQYQAAVFRMEFGNQVVTGNSDPNLSQSNAGETLHQGAELAVDVDLGAGFYLATNLTYVPTARFESGDFDGNRVPYAPRWLANATVGFSQGPLSAALMAHHRGTQFGDPTNRRDIPADAAGGIWGGRMPSYTIFDLTAQYDVTPKLTMSAAAKNLADKRYITGFRQGIYVGPERSFEIGARYHL
jgi:Fe(3+) dicitrate transport protein